MKNISNKKWKDALLKTSLPLEYLVAEKLNKLKFGIQGEYRYLRPNEEGTITEFSVDIWAATSLSMKSFGMWSSLNFLIECKYCNPSVKWIFAPHTETDTEHLFESGFIHTLDRLCTRQVWDKRPLWKLRNQFNICNKGVELQDRDATAQNIEKGRSQLRYALPRLAVHLSGVQIGTVHDEDLHIEFVCPILVTTAGLYVLNKNLSLDDFRNASSHKDLAIEVPALILTNPYSHLFSAYTDKIIKELHEKFPTIKARLKQLSKLKNKLSGTRENEIIFPPIFDFNWDLQEVSQRILVLNYNHFESILNTLRQTVVKAGKSLLRVGVMEKDSATMETRIVEAKL